MFKFSLKIGTFEQTYFIIHFLESRNAKICLCLVFQKQFLHKLLYYADVTFHVAFAPLPALVLLLALWAMPGLGIMMTSQMDQ
jgi:hypothetical protein